MPRHAAPPDLYPPTYGRLFRRHPAALCGIARPWEHRARAAGAAQIRRPRYPGGRDPRNRLRAFRVERAGTSPRFVRTAKAWGVTRNDLLIAILLAALSPLIGEARREQRRHELAVASIVNLRRDLGCRATTRPSASS